jgi:hypothetical protein
MIQSIVLLMDDGTATVFKDRPSAIRYYAEWADNNKLMKNRKELISLILDDYKTYFDFRTKEVSISEIWDESGKLLERGKFDKKKILEFCDALQEYDFDNKKSIWTKMYPDHEKNQDIFNKLKPYWESCGWMASLDEDGHPTVMRRSDASVPSQKRNWTYRSIQHVLAAWIVQLGIDIENMEKDEFEQFPLNEDDLKYLSNDQAPKLDSIWKQKAKKLQHEENEKINEETEQNKVEEEPDQEVI